jgi:hypothetical protein
MKRTQMEKFKNFLSSRKFWAALVGLMMVVLKAYAPNFPISEEQLTALVMLIASYILGTAVENAGMARQAALKPAERETRDDESSRRSSL